MHLKLIIISVLLASSLTAFAQPLLKYIPANAQVTLTIDGKRMFSKVNMDEVRQMDMYKDLEQKWLKDEGVMGVSEVLPTLFLKSEDYGLSLNTRSYLFNYKSDSLSFNCYVASLSDKQKFVTALTKAFGKEDIPEMVNKGHYVYIPTSEMALAIEANAVVFYFPVETYNRYREYEYEEKEDESYYESYEDQIKERNKLKEERNRKKMEAGLNYIFDFGKSSIAIDKGFTRSQETDFDMSMFLKTSIPGYEADPFRGMDFLMGENFADKMDKLQALYADNYTYSYLNFENGKVVVDAHTHMNDHFLPHAKAVNNAKINTGLARYIKKDALGIAGVAVNTEAIGPAFKATMFPVFETFQSYGENITAILDIVGTLIDEKEVYDLIGGDAIFAITAIKEFDVSYTTYEYDDDYNRTKVTETKKEIMPEFVFAASAGNKKLMDKIFRLMENSRAVIKKGNYYKFVDTGWGSFDMFLAHYNGVFLLTNDEELVSSHLKTGYPKANKLGGDHVKLLKKNNYYAHWEVSSTLKGIPREVMMMSKKEQQILEKLSSIFKTIQLTGMKQSGNEFDQQVVLQLEDDATNSLHQMAVMLNSMFQMNTKEDK